MEVNFLQLNQKLHLHDVHNLQNALIYQIEKGQGYKSTAPSIQVPEHRAAEGVEVQERKGESIEMLSLLSTIPNVLYYIHIYSLGIDLQDRTKKGREERNSMHPSSCTQRQLRRDKYTLNHHKKCEIIGYYCKAV